MKDPASTILPMRPIDKAVAPACNSVQLQSPARAIASHFLEAREHTITLLPSREWLTLYFAMGLAEISRFDHPVLQNYLVDDAYDETFESPGKPRPHYAPLLETFSSLPADEIRRRKHSADLSFLNQGITFTVYGREEGTERIFPYDLLPRIITSAEWTRIERGLTQRITALNLFLRDIYHEGRILSDGIVPARNRL